MNELQRDRAITRAFEIVPGMAAAKHRNDKDGALTLLHDYQLEMREAGMNTADAWACLTSACMLWLEGAIQEISDLTEVSPAEVLQRMGLHIQTAGT